MLNLRVTDNNGNATTDSVTITVASANAGVALIANAGADRLIADTDSLAGETVTLDASASSTGSAAITSFQWLVAGQVVATGLNTTARLPDGETLISLLITNVEGNTSSDSLLVTVIAVAAVPPVANAGADRQIIDSDGIPGENVTLDASASSDADGVIATYQWSLNTQQIATGVTANVRLPDDNSIITLTVTDDDGDTASAVVQIGVATAALNPVLSLLPDLSPNQRSVAVALDALCPRLNGVQQTLVGDQLNLLERCNGIIRSSSTVEQFRALDEITPQDLNAVRTQTFNLSRSQLANVSDRLVALRGGARGLSLAGLNLNSEGRIIPLDQMASSLAGLLGGGASADTRAEEKGSGKARDALLDDNLGLWMRGNYSFGSKERDIADHGFDADQWGVMGGIDYRLSSVNIVGIAAGYGRSDTQFSPSDSGDLKVRAVTGSVYATMYTQGGFYVDAIASYLQSDYDSKRRITFTEGGSMLDVAARGGTGGSTLGAAFTFGYDFNVGAFTIAPSLGYNYMMSAIDGFSERGGAGLDLDYQAQDYVSATGNAGLRMSYAWKTPVAVVLPQVRAEYLKEFVDDTESFGVRFTNDPFKDTPLILVSSDVQDRSYYRLTAGLSAQFRHGISGFVEYQRLTSMDLFDYADVAFGVRVETGF